MKIWVDTNTVDFPQGVVSGRYGASVMFVYYDKLLQRWDWVYPGGVERIGEPQEIFVEKSWARKHKLKTPRATREKPQRIRRQKKGEQLMLPM